MQGKMKAVQRYVPWTSTSMKTVTTVSVGQVTTNNLKIVRLSDKVQSLSAELKSSYNQSSLQSQSDYSATEAYIDHKVILLQ